MHLRTPEPPKHIHAWTLSEYEGLGASWLQATLHQLERKCTGCGRVQHGVVRSDELPPQSLCAYADVAWLGGEL